MKKIILALSTGLSCAFIHTTKAAGSHVDYGAYGAKTKPLTIHLCIAGYEERHSSWLWDDRENFRFIASETFEYVPSHMQWNATVQDAQKRDVIIVRLFISKNGVQYMLDVASKVAALKTMLISALKNGRTHVQVNIIDEEAS